MADPLKLGQGVMPASFKVYYPNPTQKTESLLAELGETAIGRVALVDSALWWIILLRAYTKWTGNNSLAESPNFQRAMHLILKLCLSEGCDTSPAFLSADGSSMIDRRMGIYDYPIEIQALFFMAMICIQSLLKQDSDVEFVNRITRRIQALSYKCWFDLQRLNDMYSYNTEEYSQTTLSKFSVIPKSIPDWIFDFMPSWGGHFIGNVSPAKMGFHWFCLGDFIAILSSLATGEQAQPILDLWEECWQEHVGEMPLKICYPAMKNDEWQAKGILDLIEESWQELIGENPHKICYPAMENQEWQIVTGCDPKNSRWSCYNTGSSLGWYMGKMTRKFSERIAALVRSWWRSGKNNLSSLAGSCIWQTAICCGLIWIVMRLGLDCAYMCSSSCCLTEILTEAFDASQCLFCTSLFPITDRNVMRLMKIIQGMDVSNKVKICLDKSEDGSEEEPLKSVQGAIEGIRKWCLKYGLYYDVSSIYGSSLLIFTTPAGGTFYITLEYKDRSLTLLLAGRNLYIRGWRREEHDSFEIRKGTCPSYMLGDTTIVPIAKNYMFLSPKGNVSETRIGPQALRDAFEMLYKSNGEGSTDVKQAIGIFAVHFPEAARIQRVYKTECRSFSEFDRPTLDFIGVDDPEPDLVDTNTYWIENYGFHCKEGMEFVQAAHGSGEGSQSHSSGEVSQPIHSSLKTFRELRIVNRDACLIGKNEQKPPQTEDPNDNFNKSLVSKCKAEKKRMRKSWGRGSVDVESTSMVDDEEYLSTFLLQGWYSDKDSSEEDKDSDEGEVGAETSDDDQEMTSDNDSSEEDEDSDEGEVGAETSDDDQEMTSDGQQVQCDQEMTSDHYFADYLPHFTSVGAIIEKRREELVRSMRTTDEWIPSIIEKRREELVRSTMGTINEWIPDWSANDQCYSPVHKKEPLSQRPQKNLHAPKRLQNILHAVPQRSQNNLHLRAGRLISKLGRFLRLL